MKLKGISVFERHAEKIALGICAALFLGVFMLQFLGGSNSVKVGQESVSPGQATQRVVEMARKKEGALTEARTPDLPDVQSPLTSFQTALQTPAVSFPSLALGAPFRSAESATASASAASGSALAEQSFYFPPLPAPTNVIAAIVEGTIDPFEPLVTPELARYLPREQPFDKRAVSIQATLEAARIREALSSAPEGQSAGAIPLSWWRGVVEVLDVEVVRQEWRQEPGEPGYWGPEESLDPLPGRFSLRKDIRAEGFMPRDLPAVFEAERLNRELIRRPPYYSMISGERWLWPALSQELAQGDQNLDEVGKLLRERTRILRDIENVQRQLSKPADEPSDRGGGGGGGPGDKPPRADARPGRPFAEPSPWPEIPANWFAQFGGPSGGSGEQGEDDTARKEREARRIKRLNERLAELQNQLAENDKALKALGYDPEGKRLEDPRDRAFSEPLLSLTDPGNASFAVWSHDITAELGKTYRYKFRVWVTNPLFGHVDQLSDEQKPLASRPIVALADSDWSAPIQVDTNTRYFVASAQESSGSSVPGLRIGSRSEASARVEVFHFYYGWWRKGETSLDIGDEVRADIAIPEVPIFDVFMQDKGGPKVRETRTLDARTISCSRGAYLLDVVRSPVNNAGIEVYMREIDGLIRVRSPAVDKASPDLARLNASFETGKSAIIREPGMTEGLGEGIGRPGEPGGLPPGLPPIGDPGPGGIPPPDPAKKPPR